MSCVICFGWMHDWRKSRHGCSRACSKADVWHCFSFPLKLLLLFFLSFTSITPCLLQTLLKLIRSVGKSELYFPLVSLGWWQTRIREKSKFAQSRFFFFFSVSRAALIPASLSSQLIEFCELFFVFSFFQCFAWLLQAGCEETVRYAELLKVSIFSTKILEENGRDISLQENKIKMSLLPERQNVSVCQISHCSDKINASAIDPIRSWACHSRLRTISAECMLAWMDATSSQFLPCFRYTRALSFFRWLAGWPAGRQIRLTKGLNWIEFLHKFKRKL